jgi:pentapeptide repeat protein
MADDGSQQRKPDFRTAVEDVKALATVLIIEAVSVLRRRLNLRSPAVLFAMGVVVTIVLAVVVVIALLRTGDAQAVSDNAPLIAAVIALGGVVTAQMVSIALEDQRTQEARELEAQRAREVALQNYFENVGELLIEQPLRRARPGDNLSTVVRAQTLTVLEGLDPDRKRILLQFLYESGLIPKDKTVFSLAAAPLTESDLREANRSATADPLGGLRRRAILIGANLSGANLREPSMSGTLGWTEDQLSEARSLESTTMPDGQILKSDENPDGPTFEDWIKDRESRGEDGEKPGLS